MESGLKSRSALAACLLAILCLGCEPGDGPDGPNFAFTVRVPSGTHEQGLVVLVGEDDHDFFDNPLHKRRHQTAPDRFELRWHSLRDDIRLSGAWSFADEDEGTYCFADVLQVVVQSTGEVIGEVEAGTCVEDGGKVKVGEFNLLTRL